MEGLNHESIWDMSFKKVQNIISRKSAETMANRIFPSDNDITPTVGAALDSGIPLNEKVKRIQTLANSDSSASAWINANPARYLLRMSDPTFKTAWKMRNLKEVINTELWCRCGKEKIDCLSQHLFVCSAKKIYNSVRGHLHHALKSNVTRVTEDMLKEQSYTTCKAEPKMRHFFRVLDESATSSITDIPNESFGQRMSNERRADIWTRSFQLNKNLLVDVTTASPLAQKIIKNRDYTAGLAANEAVKAKIKNYKKYFHINDTRHSSLWFFAVDTNGCLSKEARDYCKLLANISAKPGALQYIYQRISVAFQNSLAEIVFNAIHHFTSQTPNPIQPAPDPEPEIPIRSR